MPTTAKEQMIEVINSHPLDATYDEIMRELAFQRMINRGLEDFRQQRTISNADMLLRILAWQH